MPYPIRSAALAMPSDHHLTALLTPLCGLPGAPLFLYDLRRPQQPPSRLPRPLNLSPIGADRLAVSREGPYSPKYPRIFWFEHTRTSPRNSNVSPARSSYSARTTSEQPSYVRLIDGTLNRARAHLESTATRYPLGSPQLDGIPYTPACDHVQDDRAIRRGAARQCGRCYSYAGSVEEEEAVSVLARGYVRYRSSERCLSWCFWCSQIGLAATIAASITQ